MAFGRLERTPGPQPMSDINMTPLVDVMLVLVVIFIITAPLLASSIRLDLPKAEGTQPGDAPKFVTVTKPENILLAVSKDGDVYWNTHQIHDIDELVTMLTDKAKIKPQPEVHIRGDQGARYESIGRVVFACQRAGIAKVGFITEPPPNQ